MLVFIGMVLVQTQQVIDIRFSEICNCSQLVSESDCQRDLYCYWFKNKCETIPCGDFNNTNYICQASRKCYVNYNKSDCSDLTINSNDEDICSRLLSNSSHSCYDQNVWCTNQTGSDYCTLQSLSHCESLTTQQACFYNFGYCAWNSQSNSCTIAICEQLSNNQCGYYPFYCILLNNQCVKAKCSSLPEYFCNYIITGVVENGYQIQVCQYNSEFDRCQDVSTSNLGSDTCYKNTLHTYYWNKNECQKCYDYILLMMIHNAWRSYSQIRDRINQESAERLKNLPTKTQEKITNFWIIANIDAVKITTRERILFYALHDGTTTMDFIPQERQRGIIIRSVAFIIQLSKSQIYTLSIYILQLKQKLKISNIFR
ncbi:unnamed protein product [Paramecium sonneborni]|uniref:Uncharacterized protein n=1 Tax=Paramecium sonneborni TaxID=65129 RepID=A0A8S1RG67_9CILI|nr:unnamed protein product [Paramecium sonneborni]